MCVADAHSMLPCDDVKEHFDRCIHDNRRIYTDETLSVMTTSR